MISIRTMEKLKYYNSKRLYSQGERAVTSVTCDLYVDTKALCHLGILHKVCVQTENMALF